MKKILFLSFLAVLFCTASQAQKIETTLISQFANSVDTVDNTETIYLSVNSAATNAVSVNHFKGAIVVFKTQEISGTGGGTATLEVSANGVDFAAAPGQSAYTIVDQTAAQTTAWKVDGWYGKSFRIKITGAGTMSYKVWGSAVLKN